MAATKRTNSQRERDLTLIARLHIVGHSLRSIASELSKIRRYTLSFRTIGNDVQTIRERWREEAISDMGGLRLYELARLSHIEREAWREWDRSKGVSKRIVHERTGRKITKTLHTTEHKCGDPRYLDTVADCIAQRCKLLGLEAPKQLEHSGKGGGPLEIKTAEPVEVRIKKYESLFAEDTNNGGAPAATKE